MPTIITGRDLKRIAAEAIDRDTEAFWREEGVEVEGICDLAEQFSDAAQRMTLGAFLKQENPNGYLESALAAMFELGWEAHRQYRSVA